MIAEPMGRTIDGREELFRERNGPSGTVQQSGVGGRESVL